jgi:hypothetical protein
VSWIEGANTGGGGGGGESTSGQTFQFISTTIEAVSYGTSGVGYFPVTNGDSFSFQFVANRDGPITVTFHYAMSSDEAGTVVFTVAASRIADGESVNATPTSLANLSFTPGSGITRKSTTYEVSGISEGDTVNLAFTRDASGTHNGSVNILGVYA